MYMCVYTYTYIYIYTHMYAIHVTYTYMYTSIYIYIYTYTWPLPLPTGSAPTAEMCPILTAPVMLYCAISYHIIETYSIITHRNYNCM